VSWILLASPVTPADLVVLVSSVGLGMNEQLVDVPVALLSVNALYAHVRIRLGEKVKEQTDGLECSSSSPFEDVEEEVFEQDGGM